MYGYNNGFYGYNPGVYTAPQMPQQQPQMPQQQTTTVAGDDRIWVQGEVGAKAYLIAPGATVALWDSERQRIYIKSVSASGVPTMQCLNYSMAVPDTAPTTPVDNSITERVERLEKAMDGLKAQIKEVRSNVHESDTNDTTV